MLICAIHTLQYRLLFLPPPLPPPSLSSPLHHPSSHRPGPGAEAKQKQKQVKQKDAGRDRVAATCIISPVQSKPQPSIFIPPTFYLPTYPPTLYVPYLHTLPYHTFSQLSSPFSYYVTSLPPPRTALSLSLSLLVIPSVARRPLCTQELRRCVSSYRSTLFFFLAGNRLQPGSGCSLLKSHASRPS